ncbi:MAG TPA: arginine repressor [Blastocatellia bacterium]|nr:arginine repressor [Blastocatellia bacterium]
MKTARQQKILEIIGARRVATQQQLARELKRRGIEATQSSVSRDIVELGLTKLQGRYTAPQAAFAGSPIVEVETAGDNLIVIKTVIGQASATALAIDRADLNEIVGTVAGDDTLFVAVKHQDAQRAALKQITRLFALATVEATAPRRQPPTSPSQGNGTRRRAAPRTTRLR